MKGEAAIIQGYFAPLARGFAGALDLKDDAAVIAPPAGCDVVVTMDAVAAGVHFFADDAAADIGWKALAVNVSDLISKGAVPHAYTMSLAFPSAPDEAWLAGFAAGLREVQDAYGITLVGGDTDRRPGPLSITITAHGFVPSGKIVRRAAAGPGQHIFVSGTLGDSALGLAVRSANGAASLPGLDEMAARHLVSRYLRPRPPLALAPLLRRHAAASMDISDGLVKDLGRMCAASGTSAIVDAASLPLSPAARMAVDRDDRLIATIVTGGDDYEVLATVPEQQSDAFRQAAAGAGIAVTRIGHMVEGTGDVSVIGPNGDAMSFPIPGHDHF